MIRDDQFKCAACQKVFEKGVSDVEADAERKANGWADIECELVCDDCYKAIMSDQ